MENAFDRVWFISQFDQFLMGLNDGEVSLSQGGELSMPITSYACFFRFDSTTYKSQCSISANDISFASRSRIMADKRLNRRSNFSMRPLRLISPGDFDEIDSSLDDTAGISTDVCSTLE